MEPGIRNFKELEQFIKERPKEADALAFEWQEFIARNSRENPEIASIKSREGFLVWVEQHPEKNIDTSIWVGKEIQDVYLYLKIQQQREESKPTEDKKQSQKKSFGEQLAEPYAKKGEEGEKEEKRKKTLKERAQEIVEKAYDIYSKVRRSIRATRRVARPVARFAGRTAVNAGRIGGRLAIEGGRVAITGLRSVLSGIRIAMAGGRAVIAGLAAIGPVGWIVIAVIIAIIVIVVLIVMFAGGGGGATVPRPLYDCSGLEFAAPVANCSSGPEVNCVDPTTGNTILVADGNTCAANAATYYNSKQTGDAITTTCIDKCIDPSYAKICAADAGNTCPDPNFTCQGFEGTPVSDAGSKTFCIEYTITAISI